MAKINKTYPKYATNPFVPSLAERMMNESYTEAFNIARKDINAALKESLEKNGYDHKMVMSKNNRFKMLVKEVSDSKERYYLNDGSREGVIVLEANVTVDVVTNEMIVNIIKYKHV